MPKERVTTLTVDVQVHTAQPPSTSERQGDLISNDRIVADRPGSEHDAAWPDYSQGKFDGRNVEDKGKEKEPRSSLPIPISFQCGKRRSISCESSGKGLY